jgi:hypothetical protein
MQQPVRGEDGEVFLQRLGDEEPIERIAVMEGEGLETIQILQA